MIMNVHSADLARGTSTKLLSEVSYLEMFYLCWQPLIAENLSCLCLVVLLSLLLRVM